MTQFRCQVVMVLTTYDAV